MQRKEKVTAFQSLIFKKNEKKFINLYFFIFIFFIFIFFIFLYTYKVFANSNN